MGKKMKKQNRNVMKREILILTMLLAVFVNAAAQKNPVDELFDRYSGKDGVTTVYISSRMLNLFSGLNKDDKEAAEVIGRLSSIMIMSVDDSLLNGKVNFHNELGNRLNYKEFEELMVVRDGSDIVRFLIKESGTRVTELLMVTGGSSNTLISIRGDIDLKSISSISNTMGIGELEKLEQIEKKKEIKK
jgi:hypothetical protein